MNFFSCLFGENRVTPNPNYDWISTKPKQKEMGAIYLFTKQKGNGLSPDYVLASIFVNQKFEIHKDDAGKINALITYSEYEYPKLNYIKVLEEKKQTLADEGRVLKTTFSERKYIEIDVILSAGGYAKAKIMSLQEQIVFLKSVPTAYPFYISKLNFHRFYIDNNEIILLPNCLDEEKKQKTLITKCTIDKTDTDKRNEYENYGIDKSDIYTNKAQNELGGLIPLISLPIAGRGGSKIQYFYDKYCRKY